MGEDCINISTIQSIDINPPGYVDVPYLLQNLNSSMMDKLIFIGFIALLCGAWHMSKYSRNNDVKTAFITGFIDMATFVSGIAAIGFYAYFKGWF